MDTLAAPNLAWPGAHTQPSAPAAPPAAISHTGLTLVRTLASTVKAIRAQVPTEPPPGAASTQPVASSSPSVRGVSRP